VQNASQPHTDCNYFNVTFFAEATLLILFNNSFNLCAGIFTTIFWVSIVKLQYSKIVVGPSVFSFAIGTPKRSQTPSN